MAAYEVPLNTLIWPFKANWRETLTTDYEFRTTIKSSQSGKEQRRAQRWEPRLNTGFLTSAFNETEQQQLQRFIVENHGAPMVVPDYARVRLAEVISSSVIRPGAPAIWAKAGYAVILKSDTATELRHVDAVYQDGAFHLATPTGLTGAVRVYPALYGYLATRITGNPHTATVFEASIDFEAAPGLQAPTDDLAPSVMFDGREVFMTKMDWSDRTMSFEHLTKVLDNGRSRISRYNPIKFATRIYRQSFLLDTREMQEALVAFFFRMKGRRGEFFAPSWSSDLTFRSLVGSNLVVERTGAAALNANRVDRALAIFLKDGRYGFAKVTGLADNGAVLNLSLAGGMPWPVASADVLRVCWMPLCRFGSDKLSLTHLSAVTSRTELTIQTLEYLPAEA